MLSQLFYSYGLLLIVAVAIAQLPLLIEGLFTETNSKLRRLISVVQAILVFLLVVAFLVQDSSTNSFQFSFDPTTPKSRKQVVFCRFQPGGYGIRLYFEHSKLNNVNLDRTEVSYVLSIDDSDVKKAERLTLRELLNRPGESFEKFLVVSNDSVVKFQMEVVGIDEKINDLPMWLQIGRLNVWREKSGEDYRLD
ncbi:MAG: hypothetical protein HYV27_01325 [Candidatus Hydrogenedentes bacterium]|nr:hypothetical protein [Candidatus Hydrogenedentota bacterium]